MGFFGITTGIIGVAFIGVFAIIIAKVIMALKSGKVHNTGNFDANFELQQQLHKQAFDMANEMHRNAFDTAVQTHNTMFHM